VGAFRSAWQAEEVLEEAQEFESLGEAVSDCTLVLGLSGRGGGRIPHLTPRQAASEIAALGPSGRAAVVLGNEASGLNREERAQCQRQVRIPSHPRQPSLNLGQAAMVSAYEIFLAASEPAPPPRPRAAAAECERALSALRDAMLAIGFLSPQKPETRFAEWRELFGRAGLSPRETRLLMALARRMAGAARRKASGERRSRREG